MYRRGEFVSRQLHSMDVQDTCSRGYISPEMASPSGSSSPYTPNFYSTDQRTTTGTYSNELALSGKIEQDDVYVEWHPADVNEPASC